jgi:hypothetical protein
LYYSAVTVVRYSVVVRPPRSVVIAGSVIAATAALVAVVVLLGRGGSTTGGGSGPETSPSGGVTPVAVGSTYPMSYVIVYRVIQNEVPHWEVLSVQRPFSGSDLTYMTSAAPHQGDTATSGNLSTMTGLYAVGAQGVQLVSARQPGPPSGDQYLGAEIQELTRRGLAADVGSAATVAGRPCEVYRFAGPPAGPLAPVSGSGDHDDLCLDVDGLTLSEVWTYHGKVVLQRTAVDAQSSTHATAVSSAPTAPSTTGARPASAQGATVTADAKPATFITAPPAPTGFQAAGSSVDFSLPDPQQPSQTAATSVVWTFTDGIHLISVEAGSERGGALPWQDGDTVTAPVTLAGLGPAATAVRSDGFELRIDLGGGRWVRVRGTVPLDTLVSYGHRLVRAAAAPTGG